MMTERECTECGEWIEMPESGVASVTCPGCATSYTIEPDAEFIYGMWHDRTIIRKVTVHLKGETVTFYRPEDNQESKQ